MPELTHTETHIYAPIPILWKSSDIAEKRARSMRRFGIGIAVSIVAHILLMVFVKMNPDILKPGDNGSPSQSLVVNLAPPTPREPVTAPTPNEIAPPASHRTQPRIMAVPRRNPDAPTVPIQPPDPPPVVVKQTDPEQPSMMAMVEAARARRQAQEDNLKRYNAEARAGDPSAGNSAEGALNRNLQTLAKREGTSGVFQILQIGHRSGQFAFRGWTTEERSGWKEVIEVDAGPQGDVQLAMIRKMIELIRKHYKGNFNWDSYRLGRVVTLSARIEDSAGLESFLMREFFTGRNQ
ncbi:MAG: hypothetical protein JNN20_13090 [Betaproteobacteria bacterium]|nr:hypothetical protein [Betaproteobacteria bacterium]